MTKNDEKEIITPAEPSKEDVTENKDEVKEPEQSSEANSSDLDKQVEDKQKQLEQLQESTKEETERLQKLREERRTLGEASAPVNDSGYEPLEEEADVDTKKEALKIFYKYHPEYSPENDPGNEKYGKLDSHYRRIKSGTSLAEQVESLEYIHETFIKPKQEVETKEEEVAPEIGSTSSVTTQTNKDSALTKKLNKWEVKAAQNYPGGEKAYREHLVKLKKKK